MHTRSRFGHAPRVGRPFGLLMLLLVSTALVAPAQGGTVPFDFAHIAALRQVTDVAISPDATTTAFVVSVPRRPGVDEDGPAWAELHVAGPDGTARPFVSGTVNVSQPAFHPDGKHLLYLAARNGDEHAALWAIPLAGGESHKVLGRDSAISAFALSSDGRRVAFVAVEANDEARTKRLEQGFTEEVLGEDKPHAQVWVHDLPSLGPEVADPTPTEAEADTDDEKPAKPPEPSAFDVEGSVSRVAWAPDGASLFLAVAPDASVDAGYMYKRLRRVHADDGSVLARFANPGKMGAFAVSPDGRHVALVSAADFNDPKDGRLFVAGADGGTFRDLWPGFEGHVSHVAWRDADTMVYVADIGTETEVGTMSLDGTRTALATSGTGDTPLFTKVATAGDTLALIGQRSTHPSEAFHWRPGNEPQRLSHSNPWLASMAMARQEVVTWTARDGLELEGILIHPLEKPSGPAPLMMIVHGGPEGHVHNGWVTSYSRPGQLAAQHGYAVFYPNYRGSTGRGVAFSKLGQGDAAGPEFDDLIDGIDHLIEAGIADRDRVGVTGGSYGGYATAWCATRYTDRFRAGVMFNGISNKHTKAITTDIPAEDRAVHTLYDPWTRASFALERSPLHYVEQSRTPLLIVGGAADTRVHPAQSLQLWTTLRMLDNAPVRLVRYPGEPHGNRRAASRDDYTRRLMRWMNHFVLEDGQEAPPWEIER